MAKLTERQQLVLEVLEGQSPEYLIAPGASAFLAEGLEADDVEHELEQLAKGGLAEFVTVTHEVIELAVDDDGKVLHDDAASREFAALSPDELEAMPPAKLKALQKRIDAETGEPLTVSSEVVGDAGWRLTDAGRSKLG